MKKIFSFVPILIIVLLTGCESMLSTNLDFNAKDFTDIFDFSTSKNVNVEIVTLDQQDNRIGNVYHEIFCNGKKIAAGRSLPGGAYLSRVTIPSYIDELIVKSRYGKKTSETTVPVKGQKLDLEIPKSDLQIENSLNLYKSVGTAEYTYTVEAGAANFSEKYAEVRYRSFKNTGGNEIYIGPDIDEEVRNEALVNWDVGNTHNITFDYDATTNIISTTVSVNGIDYSQSYDIDSAPVNHINSLQIDVVMRDNKGIVELNNLTLDGNGIGNFSGEGWNTWKVYGFDFTNGFSVTTDLFLDGKFTGSQEKCKVQLTFGYDDSYPIDTDGDGVMDDVDEYPNNPALAFNNNTTGTLAFEDLWPEKGDYDFNDMVVDYDINQITNANNEIAQIGLHLDVVAAGAQYNNAFGIEIPGLLPGNVSGTSGDFRKQTSIPDTDISRSGNFVIVPFDNVQQLFNDRTYYINTKYYPVETISTLNYTIELASPIDSTTFASLTTPPYNPFIIIKSELDSAEVHLMGKTSTFYDTGDMAEPYKDDNGMPWAIDIAEKFDYPLEKVDIRDAFNYFQAWAESDGNDHQDWYKDLDGYRDSDSTYTQAD